MIAEEKNKLRRQAEVSAIFKNIFESVDGQAALDHLKFRFFVTRSTIDGGPVDPDTMIFNEGSRAAIMYIIDLVELDLEPIHQALEEPDPAELEDDFAT